MRRSSAIRRARHLQALAKDQEGTPEGEVALRMFARHMERHHLADRDMADHLSPPQAPEAPVPMNGHFGTYWLRNRMSETLVVLRGPKMTRPMLHVLCRTRQPWTCWLCRESHPAGDLAYRELESTSLNRMNRICPSCVKRAETTQIEVSEDG